MDSNDALTNAIIGVTNTKPIDPKNVVIAEYWYDPMHRFKIFVDDKYWFWADTREIANEIANAIKENRMPAEWSLVID